MKTFTSKLNLKTQKQFELLDITSKVAEIIRTAGVTSGIVSVFAPHSTASIKLNHNEPLLLQDFMKTLYRLVPVDTNYAHDTYENRSGTAVEERSNGHAHVKAFLLGASEVIPIEKTKMLLGPRQSIFFVELDGGRARNVLISVLGE